MPNTIKIYWSWIYQIYTYFYFIMKNTQAYTQTSTLNARTHTATQEKTLFNCCVTRMKVVRFGNSFNFFAPT